MDLSIPEWLDVENPFFLVLNIWFQFKLKKKKGFVTHRTLQENVTYLFMVSDICVYLCRPGQTLCQQKKHGGGKVSIILLEQQENNLSIKMEKALYCWSINVSGEKAAQSWFSTTYVVAAIFHCYATSLNDWPNITQINLLPKVALVLFMRTFIFINSVEEAILQV